MKTFLRYVVAPALLLVLLVSSAPAYSFGFRDAGAKARGDYGRASSPDYQQGEHNAYSHCRPHSRSYSRFNRTPPQNPFDFDSYRMWWRGY